MSHCNSKFQQSLSELLMNKPKIDVSAFMCSSRWIKQLEWLLLRLLRQKSPGKGTMALQRRPHEDLLWRYDELNSKYPSLCCSTFKGGQHGRCFAFFWLVFTDQNFMISGHTKSDAMNAQRGLLWRYERFNRWKNPVQHKKNIFFSIQKYLLIMFTHYENIVHWWWTSLAAPVCIDGGKGHSA